MKKKILIIDDEKSYAEIVKFNLDYTEKYDVIVENDGLKGLEAVKRYKPDLILLDIMMPGISGDKLAAQIRNDEGTKNIPVIFLTSLITEAEADKRKNVLPLHSFIAKSSGIETLLDTVQKHIK
jgi:CheY-like chemotaxis protein